MSQVKTFPIIEMILAASLWGFGFTAAVWALEIVSPLWLTALRFILSSVALFPFLYLNARFRQHLNWSQFKLALWPGIFLCLTLVLQTWGLLYTTATKSSFITCLYVLGVPLLEQKILARRLPKHHWLMVGIALIGTTLICDLSKSFQSQQWNIGDLLTLLCAVAASVQIFWFGLIGDRIGSALTFNFFQGLWAGVPVLIIVLFLEPFPNQLFGPVSLTALAGILSLSFGSTLIAFAIQIHAQKSIRPSLASLLCLLESPFGAVFAIYFLHETLSFEQWIGASTIFIAALMAILF